MNTYKAKSVNGGHRITKNDNIIAYVGKWQLVGTWYGYPLMWFDAKADTMDLYSILAFLKII